MYWFPLCLGWLTVRVANPAPTAGRVFFLRGNGVVFSSGFGVLCRRLREEGVWAEDLRCVGDGWLCSQVLRERHEGPLVLVGHSRGGRRALAAAEELAKHGVGVDLVVGVDVAFPPPVPGNVARAVHIYRSVDRVYPVRPFVAASASTSIENVDLDAAQAPFSGVGIHHLNFTTNLFVQEWLHQQIVMSLASRAA